jgi:hypothetical protein
MLRISCLSMPVARGGRQILSKQNLFQIRKKLGIHEHLTPSCDTIRALLAAPSSSESFVLVPCWILPAHSSRSGLE